MAFPCPPFVKSDHDYILLLPSDWQKLKQEVPVLRTIQSWCYQSESSLQDGFDQADWDMFRVASENNIDEYNDTVTEFIRKCIGTTSPIHFLINSATVYSNSSRGQTTCPPRHPQHPMSQKGQKDHEGQQQGKVSTGASKMRLMD
jgi:hypothetical protein